MVADGRGMLWVYGGSYAKDGVLELSERVSPQIAEESLTSPSKFVHCLSHVRTLSLNCAFAYRTF